MNLCNGSPSDFADFARAIVGRAARDHREGRAAPNPLGKSLCMEFCDGWRRMHHRLASTIYNQTRTSMEVADSERDESSTR